jgi:hypothetical protein
MRNAPPIDILMKFRQNDIAHTLLPPRRVNAEAVHFIDGFFLHDPHVMIPNRGNDLCGITENHDVISRGKKMLLGNIQDGGLGRGSKMSSEIASDFCEKGGVTWGTENLTGGPLDHRKALFLPGERGKGAVRQEGTKKRGKKTGEKGKHMRKGVCPEYHVKRGV